MSLKFKIAVHVIAGAAYHTCRLWLGKLFGLYFSITDCNGKDQVMQERKTYLNQFINVVRNNWITVADVDV